MRSISLAVVVLVALVSVVAQTTIDRSGYPAVKEAAERHYAEKSFARANELYRDAKRRGIVPAEDERFVEFRIADTSWRAAAANPTSDPSAEDLARQTLETLIRQPEGERDRIWAEANESLGDLFWTHPRLRDPSSAQQYYLAALDWWAGSDDLPLARRRYLAIVFRMADLGAEYGWMPLPREILLNALAIAERREDVLRLRFLLASELLREGSAASTERALELLDAVIAEGKSTRYYAEALHLAAQQLAQGVPFVTEDGRVEIRPDYGRALLYYRRIVTEFSRGSTPYFDSARQAIEEITSPSLGLMVEGTFLPASEQEVVLSWRNVRQVELSVTRVSLVDDVQLPAQWRYDWQQSIRTSGRAPVRRWTQQFEDRGQHVPGTDRIRIAPRLERGAYVVEANAGGRSARQLLLVTDASILTHGDAERLDLLVQDAVTGRPLPGARVRVWSAGESGRAPLSRDLTSGKDGLATLRFDAPQRGAIIAFASLPGGAEAFLSTGMQPRWTDQGWRVYAFTDRPAYRPGETVRWKFIARVPSDNDWTTPAGAVTDYKIVGPRGEEVASGKATLNEFGTFWSELPLTSSMPLGVYTLHLGTASTERRGAASAQLFRLEEYKLPEFRVQVVTTGEDGQPRAYRTGETVQAAVEAEYYFGGPVAGAEVEVVIRSRPFYRGWPVRPEHSWYLPPPQHGYAQERERRTLRTDANGRAVVSIPTSLEDGDTEWIIEARVTDASRREVSGQGTVRVTRQRYSVMAQPRRRIVAPAENAIVDFRATDANDQPVQTTGRVTVIRREWEEIWIDPLGREVGGAALERMRSGAPFPPPEQVAAWRRKLGRYREETVLETTLTTDAKGEAALHFRPARTGYYSIRWSSEDRTPGRPLGVRDLVTAETAIWVGDRSTTHVGYNAGGLEILVDQESYRSGGTAHVMIATPASGRWVMVTTSADSILETQVLQLDGTVKLLPIALDGRHSPSFHLTASSVFDRALATATQQLVVPPVERFIEVEVKSDREAYGPRDEASLVVTTRDVDGRPLPAEVALAVSDESVTAIADDPAGDPRRFFYGRLRPNLVRPAASVQQQRYLRLVEIEGVLVDDRDVEARRRQREYQEEGASSRDLAMQKGVIGRVVSNVAPPPPPPAPVAAPMPQSAVAESIIVTGSAAAVSDSAQQMEIQVRSDFSSTAFWQPDLMTGQDGTARVTVRLPEALTTWRATARAVTRSTQIGIGSSTMKTTMPLLVRLQAPRFLVAGDRVTVSAVVNNNTDAAVRVMPSLEAEGVTLVSAAAASAIDVPARGEGRADWTVEAKTEGRARLKVTARAGQLGDAMERTIPVYEHGIEKLIAHSGVLRGDEAVIRLELPRDRRDTEVVVRVQPSIAVTMLDALPYLIDFPYGCTEQTMSRFLPAAIVARTLMTSGIAANEIEGRLFGGLEKEHLPKTQPGGARELAQLGRVTSASMKRLYDMQLADGGWGWWKEGPSDDFMTAYVVWGFAIAKEGGLPVDERAVERAVRHLDVRLVQYERAPHQQAWMLHAIGAWNAASGRSGMTANQQRAFDNVWSARERLTAYSRALFALAAHDFGQRDRAQVLVRNLENGVRVDSAPDRSILLRGSGRNAAETMATAHWGESGFWWRWYDGPVESTAFALRALLRIDPENRLVEPAMNWLVKNRRGAQWSNTRDTAIAVLALNDYLKRSGELQAGQEYEVAINGQVVDARKLTTVLGAPARIAVDARLVRDVNEIRIRRTGGSGRLYFAVEGRFVSLEEPVRAAGNELFVRRDYFRLVPKPTLLKGVNYERLPLRDQGSVVSGERIEVVLTIETKNDYEYLVFEDLKPAGFEAVSLQSGGSLQATEVRSAAAAKRFAAGDPPGSDLRVRRAPHPESTGRTVPLYQELRDRHTAFFATRLPQGIWEIRYTLRAETPGSFHAMPLLGHAMYVPEIRANGEEVRLTVDER